MSVTLVELGVKRSPCTCYSIRALGLGHKDVGVRCVSRPARDTAVTTNKMPDTAATATQYLTEVCVCGGGRENRVISKWWSHFLSES